MPKNGGSRCIEAMRHGCRDGGGDGDGDGGGDGDGDGGRQQP